MFGHSSWLFECFPGLPFRGHPAPSEWPFEGCRVDHYCLGPWSSRAGAVYPRWGWCGCYAPRTRRRPWPRPWPCHGQAVRAVAGRAGHRRAVEAEATCHLSGRPAEQVQPGRPAIAPRPPVQPSRSNDHLQPDKARRSGGAAPSCAALARPGRDALRSDTPCHFSRWRSVTFCPPLSPLWPAVADTDRPATCRYIALACNYYLSTAWPSASRSVRPRGGIVQCRGTARHCAGPRKAGKKDRPAGVTAPLSASSLPLRKGCRRRSRQHQVAPLLRGGEAGVAIGVALRSPAASRPRPGRCN